MTPDQIHMRLHDQAQRLSKRLAVTEAELLAEDRRELRQMAWTAGWCLAVGMAVAGIVWLLARGCA
jgi:hypothetical protein